jgi:hypothetical protein
LHLLLVDGGLDTFQHLAHLNHVQVVVRRFVVLRNELSQKYLLEQVQQVDAVLNDCDLQLIEHVP